MAEPGAALGRRDILERVGDLRQWGGTRLVTLEEGAERGVRVVEVSTAAGLDFGVVVDRALDIGWFRWRGKACAWLSPTGFAGPWYREPDGLGFLRSFGGGLVATCGLDHILFPQVDAHDTYDYPGRTETSYGLHGRVSSTPGILRQHGTAWDGDTATLFVEGDVRQAGALAENLVLHRRISTTLDGLDVLIEDEVTNEGHYPTPHMYLYHMNLGAPLLDAGTELVAPILETTWQTPTATTPGEHLEVPAPRSGFLEQAFLHTMATASDGTVSVGLVNHAVDAPWGLEVRYESAAFPVFLQWRYLDAGTYVIGFEPSTNGVDGREKDREAGRLILLEPGASRRYRTLVRILPDAAACDDLRERVARSVEGAGILLMALDDPGPGPVVSAGATSGRPSRGSLRGFRELGIFAALVVVLGVFAIINPVFLSPQNIADVTRNASFTFVAAVGASFVFAAGGLDLSVGSLFGVGAVAGGLVVVDAGLPIPLGIIAGILAAAGLGLVNGLVIVRGRIPALVATLGMLYAARGLIMIVTEGQPVFPFPREFTDIVIARIAGIPVMVLLAIVLAVVAHYTLNHLRFGREVLAIGGNREAARLVGIAVDRISIVVYILSGAAAGLAGILAAARLGTAQASAGTGFELTVIAAVIIGGTSMFGGSATIIGTLIGSLLLAVLSNGMTIIGLSPFYQNLLVGVVIVLAVALDQWRRSRPA